MLPGDIEKRVSKHSREKKLPRKKGGRKNSRQTIYRSATKMTGRRLRDGSLWKASKHSARDQVFRPDIGEDIVGGHCCWIRR